MTKPVAVPTVPTGPSDAEFAEAHRRLIGDSSIQFELKGVDPPQPPPQWLQSLADFLSSIWPAIEILVEGLQRMQIGFHRRSALTTMRASFVSHRHDDRQMTVR